MRSAYLSVMAELEAIDAAHPDEAESIPIGNDPDAHWPGLPYYARGVEMATRRWNDCNPDRVTHMSLLIEEVAEASAADDLDDCRAELAQVAALAVRAIAEIDRRAGR